jgi:hypothetical protein
VPLTVLITFTETPQRRKLDDAICRRVNFALHQGRPPRAVRQSQMANCLFTCPSTKMKVQYWLDDDEEIPANEYEAIRCKSCDMLHLINRKSGKLLGWKEAPNWR